MAWGSKQSATQLTSITDTEQFFSFGGSSLVTLNPGETAHVEVDVNFVGSPTDDMVVSVYATVDTSSADYDDTPFHTFAIDKGTDPNKAAFVVSGVKGFRIGVKASGSTDTHTSADCNYAKDGVSL